MSLAIPTGVVFQGASITRVAPTQKTICPSKSYFNGRTRGPYKFVRANHTSIVYIYIYVYIYISIYELLPYGAITMNPYLCIYIYICVIYACIHLRGGTMCGVCVLGVYIHICEYVYVCICVYVCMYVCKYVWDHRAVWPES